MHEGFFQWLQKLSMGKYVSLEGNREQNYNADSHVCIKRTQVDKINLQGTQGCNVNGEVLIARLGDREPITEGIARLVDRNWIDVELIKQWKKTCELEHGEGCLLSHHGHLPRPSLPWLIDTVDHCLVEGGHKATYVALSYVWGGLDVFKTTREILPALLQPGALHHQERLLPRTISDAMSVVRLLGERYLWVDALCIVQDDEKIRHSLVNDMGAVYANATLTIVAADSSDADSGLRGLRGLSGPRNNPCIFEWPDGTRLNWPGTGGLSCSVWNERGWTFQEYLFSRRRLIFVAESVRWECRTECSWEEYTLKGALPTPEVCSEYDTDVCNIRKTPAIVSLAFPDMVSFATLVNAFNDRQLTFEDDAMDAFSGVATALAQSFIGGFLWGVPVMFLDLALVWRAFPTVSSSYHLQSF